MAALIRSRRGGWSTSRTTSRATSTLLFTPYPGCQNMGGDRFSQHGPRDLVVPSMSLDVDVTGPCSCIIRTYPLVRIECYEVDRHIMIEFIMCQDDSDDLPCTELSGQAANNDSVDTSPVRGRY